MRYAIITSGHSGSTWLATALHRPVQGVVAFHEPLVHIVGPLLYSLEVAGERPDALARPRLLQTLAPYLEWAQHRQRQFEAVGEIHTELSGWWSQALEFLPQRRTMTVRHGIQVVHSWFQVRSSLPVDWNPGTRPIDLVVPPPGFENAPPERQLFAYLCVRWNEQVDLAKRLEPMEVYRLEDLTTDAAVLARLVRQSTGKELTPAECTAIQGVVINRKVMGDRSPENLFWNVWDEAKRDMFRCYCGPALERFGYSIPPQSSAPPRVDAPAQPPPPKAETGIGAFAPLWVFASNPSVFPVLVYGSDQRALLAADLLMRMGRANVYLAGERDDTWQVVPQGFQAMSIEPAAHLGTPGIFIADDAPSQALVERLSNSFPGAEIVTMLPMPLTAEQRERRWESGRSGPGEHHDALQRGSETAPVESSGLLTCGPFHVGDALAPDWCVTALHTDDEGLRLSLRSEKDGPLFLDLKANLHGQRSAFPVAEGGLHYRSTEIAYARIAPVCEAVARRARQALAGASLAQTLRRWRGLDDAAVVHS